jgi:hypothetical protein
MSHGTGGKGSKEENAIITPFCPSLVQIKEKGGFSSHSFGSFRDQD